MFPNPGGRVAAWTMSDIIGGDQEGQASPSEGANTQDGPEPAPEPEVIEVALSKTGRDRSQACLHDKRGQAGYARCAGGDYNSRW